MNTPAPALFIGHGSPENAIRDNAFTQSLQQLGKRLPRPKAALVISAHWLARGLAMTTAPQPRQVFDFSGFPDALYDIRYQPRTSPELIQRLLQLNSSIQAMPDQGFDHGVWTVLKHLWPDADVPLVQLGLDVRLDRAGHLALGESLRELRNEGYIIVASGNIVHNLRELDWRQPESGFPWAQRYDLGVKKAIESCDNAFLTQARAAQDGDARLSVPSEDHYWPLLYVTGARLPTDRLEWSYEGYEYGGISLRSFLLN
ncbi:4,5-DOPA dioxygenase extradiol [Fluviicoccus keumensis]|uniref:4,5-DOPA dioxygenase extradiol n=1 Tax=Fluviicoccus keumensis TaxID=1435465 RepID=A0A4Q7Z8H3_9GAMM|nr:4,5-DOPA dioxygenase extradiol [Fluviicoccus keumensis]RZU46822.1 4,5-DOPA dioxygenase extradiol [Fluviicoccus keumensis]